MGWQYKYIAVEVNRYMAFELSITANFAIIAETYYTFHYNLTVFFLWFPHIHLGFIDEVLHNLLCISLHVWIKNWPIYSLYHIPMIFFQPRLSVAIDLKKGDQIP